MIRNIIKTNYETEIKNHMFNSFKNIESKVDEKINVFKEPSMEPAIKYLELNSKLIKQGWLSNPPRHPRESDK